MRNPRVIPSTLLPSLSAGWLLFLKLKIGVKGKVFEAVSSFQQTVTRQLKPIQEEAFCEAFDSLHERCKLCSEAAGVYVE
jgi:hypothetical protein